MDSIICYCPLAFEPGAKAREFYPPAVVIRDLAKPSQKIGTGVSLEGWKGFQRWMKSFCS